MACSKYTLTNTGTTITTFNYRRCDDSMWQYQVELLSNQTKNIWLIDGTYSISSFYVNNVVLVNDGAFPFIPTPSNTPTNTVTPSVTPTSTPPSVTPTQTPAPATCVEGTIPKDTNYEYKDCCYPYGQITGTAGGDGLTVCFNTTGYRLNVTQVSPAVVCETSGLTSCCEIELGYSESSPANACMNPQDIYYISVPCKINGCTLDFALGIYTDISCTTLAPDGYYSDSTNYATVSSGSFTFNGSC